jgi:tRNA(adenine34) deaminase
MKQKLPEPMLRAFAEAESAAQRGEVPVGAVIVDRSGTVIAAAGNRTLELKDPTAHAEMLVIRAAAALLSSDVTLEPCAMCAAALSFARIRRIYYAAGDEKMGAVEHGPRFFNQSTCHHAPDVYSGIGEGQSQVMLKAFFKSRR